MRSFSELNFTGRQIFLPFFEARVARMLINKEHAVSGRYNLILILIPMLRASCTGTGCGNDQKQGKNLIYFHRIEGKVIN